MQIIITDNTVAYEEHDDTLEKISVMYSMCWTPARMAGGLRQEYTQSR